MPDRIPMTDFTVTEDEHGIRVEGIIPQVWAEHVFGDTLRGLSFGFDPNATYTPPTRAERIRRKLHSLRWRIKTAWNVLVHGDCGCDY